MGTLRVANGRISTLTLPGDNTSRHTGSKLLGRVTAILLEVQPLIPSSSPLRVPNAARGNRPAEFLLFAA